MAERLQEALPEPPIVGYQQLNGRPYVADVLEVSGIYGKSGFETHLAEIDKYVLDQINRRGYGQDKAAYATIVQELQANLSIDPNLSYNRKITKLTAYVKALTRETRITEQRRALENAS